MLLFGAFLFFRLRGMGDELPQLVVPGTSELTLTETGTYTIFHETGSVVDGRYYAVEDVSGLTVEVVAAETGEAVALSSPGAGATYDFGGRSGSAFLTFDIADPGRYRITGAYPEGRAEPATVLAVGHDFGRKLVLTIVSAIAIAFTSFALAVVIAVVTFVRRRRARRSAVPPPGGDPLRALDETG
jgi:hypothetical protein